MSVNRATQNKVLRNHHVTKEFHRLKANECLNIPYDTTTPFAQYTTQTGHLKHRANMIKH